MHILTLTVFFFFLFVLPLDKIITTEAAGHGLFVDGLKFVILPVIRAMFVGRLLGSMDACIYVHVLNVCDSACLSILSSHEA